MFHGYNAIGSNSIMSKKQNKIDQTEVASDETESTNEITQEETESSEDEATLYGVKKKGENAGKMFKMIKKGNKIVHFAYIKEDVNDYPYETVEVKKEGPNKGRKFRVRKRKGDFINGTFEWVEEKNKKQRPMKYSCPTK